MSKGCTYIHTDIHMALRAGQEGDRREGLQQAQAAGDMTGP